MSTKTHLTIEEFEKLQPEEGFRYELDEGELVTMTFPSARHNLVGGNIYRVLWQFAQQHSLGTVFPSGTGFLLSVEPPTLRGPDVCFVRAERAAKIDVDENKIPGAPDLAVEVFSRFDTGKAMSRKVQQYLKAGAHTVWVVYPDTKEVNVIDKSGDRWLDASDTLDAPELLPGFSVPVASFFE